MKESIIYKIYWLITWLIYGWRIHGGKALKFKGGGSIKNGQNIYIGNDFFIGKDFLLGVYTPKGIIKIGDHVVAQDRVRISAAVSVVIGDNVLMGNDILITDNNHGTDAGDEKSYMYQNICAKPVVIGDECWIGAQVIILPGSIIGRRCIIGANSVVNGEIPAYSIAVGAPAKPIKKWNFKSNQWDRIFDDVKNGK